MITTDALRLIIDVVQVCLRTDDMDLAGDILQELCAFLNITELASTADFPDEFDRLGETLNLVKGFFFLTGVKSMLIIETEFQQRSELIPLHLIRV